jgi:glyoxylase-like metal-dependent hydrolase (beta-lactamase superfamily II)
MENTLVVHRQGRSDCVIVDPGLQPQKIFALLERRALEPVLFLITHGHADHIGGNAALKQRWPHVPLIVGAGEAHLLTDPVANLSALSGAAVVSPPADRLVSDGEVFQAAGCEFEVREIPGHSPGHVVYVLRRESPPVVLGGDVLFQGSIGRCDFPGGNQAQLISGIRTKLFTLPDETVVYPGHGLRTTIGEEKQFNPYCGIEAE